jgi:hypothetical protein
MNQVGGQGRRHEGKPQVMPATWPDRGRTAPLSTYSSNTGRLKDPNGPDEA